MKIRKLARHNLVGLSLLSEDMMTEIFLWLPLKSLIRFKRLSKRWYFLISHKDSYFRRNYLSTLSTRRRRNIRRIVGSSDDDSAIMAGFFYQKPEYWRSYDRVRFLPTTTTTTSTNQYSCLPDTQLQNYNNNIIQQQGQEGQGTTTTTTPGIEIINNINPFSSLDESLDKFLSCCLHRDQDSAAAAAAAHKKIFIAASSNGFLLCSLESFSPQTYYLVNPVTMEWVPLPKPQTIRSRVYVGFVCKGDYPSLDTVEYTIVRLSWLVRHEKVLFQFFSSASGDDDDDNQWREYICACGSLVRFTFIRRQNPLIVSTATNSDDDDQASSSTGSPGILVYFLVMLQPSMAIAILVFDLNRGDNSLQMIETPGPDRGRSVLQCADYIRQFDDGGGGGGVIHYVRICCSTDFEFWVLNTETKEWCLKHRASLKTMIKGYHPWMDIRKWNGAGAGRPPNEAFALYHIHAFHPMNPSLIFLTLYGRMVCYSVETRTLELVYDFAPQNMLDDYNNYVYQWPCWPPLL